MMISRDCLVRVVAPDAFLEKILTESTIDNRNTVGC